MSKVIKENYPKDKLFTRDELEKYQIKALARILVTEVPIASLAGVLIDSEVMYDSGGMCGFHCGDGCGNYCGHGCVAFENGTTVINPANTAGFTAGDINRVKNNMKELRVEVMKALDEQVIVMRSRMKYDV